MSGAIGFFGGAFNSMVDLMGNGVYVWVFVLGVVAILFYCRR
jgi:hypothetical protein